MYMSVDLITCYIYASIVLKYWDFVAAICAAVNVSFCTLSSNSQPSKVNYRFSLHNYINRFTLINRMHFQHADPVFGLYSCLLQVVRRVLIFYLVSFYINCRDVQTNMKRLHFYYLWLEHYCDRSLSYRWYCHYHVVCKVPCKKGRILN